MSISSTFVQCACPTSKLDQLGLVWRFDCAGQLSFGSEIFDQFFHSKTWLIILLILFWTWRPHQNSSFISMCLLSLSTMTLCPHVEYHPHSCRNMSQVAGSWASSVNHFGLLLYIFASKWVFSVEVGHSRELNVHVTCTQLWNVKCEPKKEMWSEVVKWLWSETWS